MTSQVHFSNKKSIKQFFLLRGGNVTEAGETGKQGSTERMVGWGQGNGGGNNFPSTVATLAL